MKGLYTVFSTCYEVFHGPASIGSNARYAQIPARQMAQEVLLPALQRALGENERWDEGVSDEARLLNTIDGVEYRWRYWLMTQGGHLVCEALGDTLRIYL